MKSGASSSPHLDAGHGHHPVLPCRLERRDRLAARLQGCVEALRVRGLLDHRDDRGGFVERVEHRVVVLVQLVEFRLLDLDRRADAGIVAFRVHHKENDGRSPSITLPDDPSMTMNICFPLCAYSMNHTGAWSNSPSYVVGYTWIDSRLSTRVFACFSANLCESAAAWDFASASVTSPLCTSTPPVWRLSKFILLCNWNWNPSSG